MKPGAEGTLRLKRFVAVVLAVSLTGCGTSTSSSKPTPGLGTTTTPIKHVIIVIGETHGFDNLFATYQPGDTSQQLWNLLSRQIVTTIGEPGPNFAADAQQE